MMTGNSRKELVYLALGFLLAGVVAAAIVWWGSNGGWAEMHDVVRQIQ